MQIRAVRLNQTPKTTDGRHPNQSSDRLDQIIAEYLAAEETGAAPAQDEVVMTSSSTRIRAASAATTRCAGSSVVTIYWHSSKLIATAWDGIQGLGGGCDLAIIPDHLNLYALATTANPTTGTCTWLQKRMGRLRSLCHEMR